MMGPIFVLKSVIATLLCSAFAVPIEAAIPPPMPAVPVVSPPKYVFGTAYRNSIETVSIPACHGAAEFFITAEDAAALDRIVPLQRLVVADRQPSRIYALVKQPKVASGYCADREVGG
jgi:hypothetical protein